MSFRMNPCPNPNEDSPPPTAVSLSAIANLEFREDMKRIAGYREDEIPVTKRTISPKTRLVFTRFNENFCSLATLEDKDDNFCDSSACEDNLPILEVNIKPL